ncbi:hypothetical protein, partial [Chamaesiphon sp. GL140_3_metabinner_50]|uniref:hypothetical protein n=1 Tax=Chamaesiphon sp. GL140_3_metabinner_50 TaxID=2970812 RepID=UPI0025FACE7F
RASAFEGGFSGSRSPLFPDGLGRQDSGGFMSRVPPVGGASPTGDLKKRQDSGGFMSRVPPE